MATATPRGLATLALLKTRFDEGRDHLGLFEPFITDALSRCPSNNFLAQDIGALVEEHSGLRVPVNTIQTLLGRFGRAGYVQRMGGRWLRSDKSLGVEDTNAALNRLLAEQQSLASALSGFALEHGLTLSAPDALAGIAAFISENKVPLVLHEELSTSTQSDVLPLRLTRIIARFVNQRCLSNPELGRALEGLVEGMVLRDTLLLGDLADVNARFQQLTVAIDTPILLAVLDLTGVANGIAAKEFLSLLHDTGATTIVLAPTVSEIRGILGLYEHRLSTAEGRLSLYRNALTDHIFAARLTPSDMRSQSALLERRLANAGLVVRDTPSHDPRYTLDEAALAQTLVFAGDPDPERPRIRHDVDCIAAVLTLRAGRTASTIERSGAIFCTSTMQVVRNVQEWYEGQGEAGVPPIVHQLALSSIAWLKRPASARGIKLHELSAYCSAVLRPRKGTWDKFTATLRKLRDDGTLTDDEAVAIVASDLAEPTLAQLDEDHEPDADTILDAIARVRQAYQESATATAAVVVERAQADLTLAQQAATDAITRRNDLAVSVESSVQRLSTRISGGFYYTVLAVLLSAGLLSLPGVFEAIGSTWKYVARGVIAVAAVFWVASARRGTSLVDYRAYVHERVATWLRHNVFGLRRIQ